jgi:glycerophosphoryl diester phosphodiesterase
LDENRPTSVSVIAHRGARAFAPENTVEALKKAADLGADAAEIDAQLSADGEVIVAHDDDLVRCTNARQVFPDRHPWPVCAFLRSEIESLDAGSWYVEQLRARKAERQAFLQLLTEDEMSRYVSQADLAHFSSGMVRVPTLAQCLMIAHELGLRLHIELKAIPRFYPLLAEKVIDEVHRVHAGDHVAISSFDHQQLARVHDISPAIRTGVLTSDRLNRPAEYVSRLQARAYHPGCHGPHDTIGFNAVGGKLDRQTVAEVRAAGFDVNVWTENDPIRMRALVDLGVTGIFTDYPNRLRSLLDSLE